MNVGTLEIQLMANVARLQRDMDQAKATVSNAGAHIEKAASAAKAALASIGAGIGLSQIIAMADQYAKFTAQLRLATTSTREYSAAYADVKRISTSAQQDLQATGVLYARIANGTRELGTTQKQVAAITETVNMALKVSGATAAESASAQLQLSQAFASGTLRGEEFNAVNEAAPRLMLALADGIGVPVGALKKMAEAGEITSKIMADVLPNALEKLREEAKQVQTIAGAFTVLKNNVMEFVGVQANASGAISVLTGTIGMLANNLALLTSIAIGFGAAKLAEVFILTTKSIYGKVAATVADISAVQAQRAATIAVAAAEVTRLESLVANVSAERAKIIVQLQSAQATIAATAAIGAQSTALAMNATAAKTASIAIAELAALGKLQTVTTAQLTMSQAALTAATSAGGVAASLGSRALGLLGGPVGVITTLLGLGATAWALWGDSGSKAEKVVADTLADEIDGYLVNLNKQIDKLKERNELAGKKMISGAEPTTEGEKKREAILAEINKIAKNTDISIEARTEQLRVWGGKLNAVTVDIQRFAEAQGVANAISRDARLKVWFSENGTASQKLEAELEKLRKQFGTIPPEMEKLTRAKFADKGANKELAEQAELLAELSGLTRSFSTDWASLNKMYASGKINLEQLTKAQADLLEKQPAMKAGREAEEQALKQIATFSKMYAEGLELTVGWQKKAIEAATAEAEKNEELALTFGMTKDAIELLEVARLEEQLAQRASTGLTVDEITQLEKLIDAKKRNATAVGKLDVLEDAKKTNDALIADGKRMAESIGDSLTDGLMRGFESGKGFLQNLVDTAKNLFKTLVLRPVISAVVNPVAQSITGALGFAGTAQAAGGSAAGGVLGAGAASMFGAGGLGGALAGGAGWLTGASTLGGSLTAGASLLGTGTLAGGMAGAAMIVGALAPIALGIGVVAKLLEQGPEVNTRLTFASNNAAGNISINERGNEGRTDQSYIDGSSSGAFGSFGLSSTFWMDGRQPAVQGFIKSITKMDDVMAQFLTAAERASVTSAITGKTFTANTGAEGSDPTKALESVFTGRLNAILEGVSPGLSQLISGFQGTSDALATEVQALLQYRQALKDSGEAVFGARVTLQEIAALKLPTEATSDALNRIAGVFVATNQAAKMMGQTTEEAFGAVGLASYEARQHMIELAGGLQGLTTILNDLQQAQQNYDSAVSAAKSAMKSAADQYQQFVTAVTSAEADVSRARASIASQYRDALSSELDAKRAVAEQQSQITEGYLAASQKVVEAQRKVVESFGRVGASLQEFLSSMDTTDIAGAATRDQLAASQSRLAILAAQAKAGDLNAFDKIPAIASNILKLGQDNSATREEYARIVASVRSTVADVAAFADSKVKAATPADDPKVIQLDELASAIAEQKKWADAITASGASFTTSTSSILDGYNKAVAAQVQAATSVGYWASVAQSTGTDISGTGNELHLLGQDLLSGFFTAKTSLEQAQNDLAAANAIKGDLELRQTSALENFVVAVINVNTTAQTVLDAAGALFKAASHDLLVGTELSNKSMLEAKDGMAYWGSIVSITAKGIADSVAALERAGAANAAVAAANAAALKAAAAAAAQAGTNAGANSANTSLIQNIFRSVLGREAEASGLTFWVQALTTGAMTAANAAIEVAKGAAAQSENLDGPHAADWNRAVAMADDIKGTAYLKSLGIPGFAVGINSVPNDMLAMVHRGEEITPRPYVDLQRDARAETNLLLARLVQSNAELKAELAEIKASTAKTATNTRDTAQATEETATELVQVVRGGLSFQTRAKGTEL